MSKIKQIIYDLLRKSQKYTGTDNVYLAKGGFWLTLGQVVSVLSTFLLAIAFANLLSPENYGQYKYILSLLGILQIFSLVGMKKAVTQAVARGLEESFYSGFKTKLKWSICGSLVAIGLSAYYLLRGNQLLSVPLLLIAVFMPLMEASRIYVGFLGGKRLFSIQTKYGIINQIISATTIVITLFLTKNIFWLIAVYLVSHTITNYCFYLITKMKFRPNQKKDNDTINYGKHLSLMGIISQGATYLDKIILFHFVGSVQLAVYSFAILAPEELKNILGNISTLALPKLASRSKEEIKANIMKKFWQLTLLTVLLTILYVIAAPFLFKIFFPQYLKSIIFSQVFVLSFVSVPITLLGTAFEAKMMKGKLYLIKIAPFVRIVLYLLLIPIFGIWGLIWAIIGAEIFKSVLVLFLFRKF